jgi:hypothetical protein
MENGADPNLIRLEDGRSPLHYSAQFRNVDQVKKLSLHYNGINHNVKQVKKCFQC